MGMTKYGKCKEVLKKLLKESGEEIGLVKLKHAVRKQIGADEKRTIIPSMQIMLDTNLIKDIGNCHFLINQKEVFQ